MCPAVVPKGSSRGYVIPIGGAEEKKVEPRILRKFVDLSGGDDANIVIIPTASRMDDTGEIYRDIFEDLGAKSAAFIPINSREDCDNPDFTKMCDTATGVFITGGNQLRLATILGGTSIAQSIRRRNAAGVAVAGTSAGASILSEHMIAGGDGNHSPSQDGVSLAPGMGLTNAMIIDQHFSERNRLGRLLSAVSYNPFLIGLGVDEDTAAFINPQGVFSVMGKGSVTVVDGSKLSYSSMSSAGRGEALSMLGLKLDILGEGCHYDIHGRKAFPPSEDGQGVCNLVS